MRAQATTLEDDRVRLTVEVDEEEMATAIDRAAIDLAKRVNVKGFRKGKVPKNVLVAHLGGPAALRGEAIREAVPDFYARALSDALVDPIGQPEINVTAGEEEGALVFEADVVVRPEVVLSGYDALRVTIPSPLVTDDEVDAQVDRFRETDAVLRDVDRPIVTGDLVTMDVHVKGAGEDSTPLDMGDYMYTVGSASLTPGVDDLILGMKAGEDLSLDGPLGDETATFELKLTKIQERELPTLDDAWVEENTEWSRVEEMREALADQLRRRRVIEAQLSSRDAIMVAVSDLVGVEVPELLVQDETNERLTELGRRLGQQNLSFERFLEATQQSPDQLLEALRSDATRAVRIDLALRALVLAESLEATDDEVDEELTTTAESMKSTPEQLRVKLRDAGRLVAFRAEVAKVKASRWLRDHVTYVDPEGVEVDRALLESDQSDDAAT